MTLKNGLTTPTRRATVIVALLLLLSASIDTKAHNADSLIVTLDRVINKRSNYMAQREETIEMLKQRKRWLKDTIAIINVNREIIEQYNSFICDSAEHYIHENLALAKRLNNDELVVEQLLRLSYIYSLSGLFLQATEIFNSLDYDRLPDNYKIWYCWNRIRYYENLIFYTADERYGHQYEEQKEAYRKMAMEFLQEESEEYRKEFAHALQQQGAFDEAEELLKKIFEDQQPDRHAYAMAAMNLAKLHRMTGDKQSEKEYLTIAAITDTKLAVKENEALLSLALLLHEEGDIDRAYEYIRVALDDALFYNARFKNAVIARVQPIIEDNYLKKIYLQQDNLKRFSIVTSLFALVLILTLSYLFFQVRAVTRARKELREMNDELRRLNRKLDEANRVKEHYIGHFMNQCSIYINQLHRFRKNVELNMKTGQLANLFKFSSEELKKDISELHANFDKAFLALFPRFVEEFNSLLRPGEEYSLEHGELNNELRIFALMKLGITDMKQIADFLHYSVQTVYNYRSKVKGKAKLTGEEFEEMVLKIGSIN
ncbi:MULTISPECIES: DUF6377 domain-containing protein [Petrimonas]|jgi:tetratricopeptide (TPR) repeat protein|uniref:DUF6377 domain-containing protein n=2 Tax=Petrimonas mucosa TaxID=1642646 RepID=A0A1G4G318_9BACT|nr:MULTISPECIES: DUF6377 domain-containing protein [Petrimonas]MDD3560485.1 DUF6377 domain-containing protein [Petrimonas mucosa]SCM55168.1 putative protein {ECO:0000313/EMBL:EFS30823,1} [Petrimonas mucosa]SFU40302.1 hypothetical protein SAMN05216364_100870 [Porphyromonadaceae bacterium KHP3R9]HHT30920.1 tetratricopeptide repeat protein [Petrimonas mucosa]